MGFFDKIKKVEEREEVIDETIEENEKECLF
jgi:hypothetical protein